MLAKEENVLNLDKTTSNTSSHGSIIQKWMSFNKIPI